MSKMKDLMIDRMNELRETEPIPLRWQEVKMKVKDLLPNAKNPRKWRKGGQEELDKSLEKFHQVAPSIINYDGTLIDGHRRMEQMMAAGWSDMEVDVRKPNRQLTQEEVGELMVRMNTHQGMWDLDGLSDGLFEGFDFEGMGLKMEEVAGFKPPKVMEAVEDDGPGALPDAGVTVHGDVWELVSVEKGLRHRVMCGDSTSVDDLDKLMQGELVELFLTDPPYGVSYANKNKFLNAISRGNHIQEPIQNDHLTVDDCGKLWVDVFTLAETVMTNKASYYIFSAQWQDLMMMMMMMIDKVFSLKHCLIWVKNNHVLGRSDYNYKHEPFLFGWKKKGTHEFFGGFQTSVFEFPKPQKNDLHPTMKPILLFAKLIENSTKEGYKVYDSFLGSGTTLIACEQLHRHCLGMELDEKYCDVIVRRWVAWMEKEGSEYEVHLNGAACPPERLNEIMQR